MDNMDLPTEACIIEIEEETSGIDARNEKSLQNNTPPWILDVCQDVIKYDVGIKIRRGEFKLILKEIKRKWIWCTY